MASIKGDEQRKEEKEAQKEKATEWKRWSEKESVWSDLEGGCGPVER